ncbi:MAG: hypothetical protein IPG59_13710 [Candidatus Melainabacteria bacterium]|nr:MAG: hypothetical protein IPG59_13710 [Candidatus Melainabacteria bacterium]
MYTIYVLVLVGLAIGFLIYLKGTRRTFSEFVFNSLMGGFIGCIAGLVIAMLVSSAVPKTLTSNEPVTLVSMRNQDGLTGSFIFGSGSINSSMSYNFLMKQKDGSMVPGTVLSSEVVHFIEDPELKNIGYWQTTIRRSDPSHWLYKWTIFHSDHNRIARQEFRVPVGSVIQQFNIR